MKAVRTAAAIAAAGGLLATGSLAFAAQSHPHAAATQRGGTIRIFVTHFTNTKARITIIGAIGDYGTIVTTNKAGKVTANGTYQHARLKHGTLTIDTTAFDKKLNSSRPQVNQSNCSVSFDGTGPSTITGGTGQYAGAHGSVRITATFAGIATRKANGQCNLSNNAPTLGGYDAITGKGSVSFGS